ncbi:hypothetical protein [Sphingomonas sp. ACRSK]|uniref:hypothetical protein n=1 Tax=Sphingomonas sp. ACRSK TaxID=2918213 RepID=UPI001EF4762B|nr:hypothetical protein [Sphingomonas sp. ACRSK]MCG7349800.1 hypothetical protein [Sphingomonas sp. ACRSK]
MNTEARWDLTVRRNDDVWERPLRIIGPNLTGVDMRAQIRLAGDTPGAPLADLQLVTNGNAEGVRLASATQQADGTWTNDVRIRLNKSTRQALPYAGEVGDAATLEWGFLLGGVTRIEGKVFIPAQVYGSDAAPLNRPPSYGTRTIAGPAFNPGATLAISQDGGATLAIDGADLLAPYARAAQDALDQINDFTQGPTGPANSTYTTLTDLRAAPISNRTYNFAPPAGSEAGIAAGSYLYREGNFSGPDYADDVTRGFVVALDAAPLSEGALVLSFADSMTTILDAQAAIRRRLLDKTREIPTLHDFGVIGDGTNHPLSERYPTLAAAQAVYPFVTTLTETIDTAGIQAAINWSSANKRLVEDRNGGDYVTGPLVLRAYTMLRSAGLRASIIRPRAFTSEEVSSVTGHLTIQDGPVNETFVEGFRFEGDYHLVPNRIWGWYFHARKNEAPGAYPHGGLFYSTFRRCTVKNYYYGSKWLRAGSYGTGANPNDRTTYDFLRPHQFLIFDDCHFDTGNEPDSNVAILRTGQNAQQLHTSCSFQGPNLYTLICEGPEAVDSDNVVRGSWNRPGTTNIAISSGGGFNEFHNCWPQRASRAVLSMRVNANKYNLYCENIYDNCITLLNALVSFERCYFANAGAAADKNIFALLGNVIVSGYGCEGSTNGFQINSAAGENRAVAGLFVGWQKTKGLTTQVTPVGNGELNFTHARSVFVTGAAAGTNPVPITSISCNATNDEEIIVTAHNGPVVFANANGLRIPGGRVILRPGDTTKFRRVDSLGTWWEFGRTVAPLQSNGMPTSGYFEIGERVRNTQTPPSSGTYASEFYRLTSNTNHVAGADWRTLQETIA